MSSSPTASVPEFAIASEGLRKAFGRHVVLDGLDFSVAPGMAVGLLGANGAGKTTLIKLLLGLMPLDGGKVTVFGEGAGALTPAVRGRIAYVPQFLGQFAWLTGSAMLRYIAAFYSRFDWAYAKDLIERWKVSLRTQIAVLSPGQQQRLSIVRALVTRPDLIVLDEPIASLDPATRIAVIEELIEQRRQRPLTVLFSSHITGDLRRLCTHLAVLAEGRIAAFDAMDNFLSLARVTLEGEEGVLEGLALPAARRVRRPHAGSRVLLLEQTVAHGLTATLPTGIRVQVDEPELEVTLTEWMRWTAPESCSGDCCAWIRQWCRSRSRFSTAWPHSLRC